jgi:hypothetical protein
MKKNVGSIDRIIRLTLGLGIVLGYLLGIVPGGVALIAGIVLSATGFAGICPLYSVCGSSSIRKHMQKEPRA